MKFQTLSFLAFNIALLAACGPGGTSNPTDSATAEGQPKPPTQMDIDKDAFLTARQAASLRTWSAANLMLERIDVAKIKGNCLPSQRGSSAGTGRERALIR
jgi:hypothetical protein